MIDISRIEDVVAAHWELTFRAVEDWDRNTETDAWWWECQCGEKVWSIENYDLGKSFAHRVHLLDKLTENL